VLKKLPRVGPPELGGSESGRFTKRWITFAKGTFQWSADEIHIQKVIEYCCADRRTTERVIGPGSKTIGKAMKNAADELEGMSWSEYRTMAPPAHYVAADRPDIQYTTAVLMRSLDSPTVLQQQQLFRLGAYLNKHPVLLWIFEYQEMPVEVYVEVDSDWAQCPRTRRSTGGGLVIWGKHLLDAYVGQEQSVSLSSAESELHQMVQGAARGLHLRNILAEVLETAPRVRVGSDASAAIGITARLGAGRVRHLEAKELWIQEKVRAKEVTTTKIGTKVNRADLLTKFLDGAQHHALLALLPLLWATTRCGSGTAAVAALILTMPAEAREEYDDEGSAVVGWGEGRVGSSCGLVCGVSSLMVVIHRGTHEDQDGSSADGLLGACSSTSCCT
jgi:hypothetical protein